MYRSSQLALILALAALLVVTSVPLTGAAQSEDQIIEKQFTSQYGIEYEVRLNLDTHVLEIRARNPSNRHLDSSIVISVDQTRIHDADLRLGPNGTWQQRVRLRSDLDALEEEHTASVSTFGARGVFNFTYQVSPENPHGVEVPHITNITVGNAQIDGEPSAVANVTVVNPSPQTYPTKLMVHTEGTDGSFYLPSVGPGESETITVELLDERGTQIVGEARLYAGEFNESDGGLDQVGFAGRAGEDTETWDESYDPVAAPWSDDPYQYRNDSVSSGPSIAERASGGHDIGGLPLAYPVLAVIGVGLVVVRLR